MSDWRSVCMVLLVVASGAAGACGGIASGDQGSGGNAGSSTTGGGSSNGTGGSIEGTGGTSFDPMCTMNRTMSEVAFKLVASGDTASQYCIGQGCASPFVSIKSATGQSIDVRGGCITSCEVCTQVACGSGACAPSYRMNPNGETFTWDGRYFTASTCGAGVACTNLQCAMPGTHFVATMCAYPSTNLDGGGFCVSSGEPTCVDVPFDYPSTGVVMGVLNP